MKKIILFLVCNLFFVVASTQTWVKIKAGSEFSLAIKSDGTLWGWGFNGNGQLGMSSASQSISSPTQITDDTDWKEIAAGSCHSFALKNNGTLWASGLNGNGQVGAGEESQYEEFVQIGTDTDWVFIEAGYVCSYAIKKDGSLWAWGYNENGQLGVGDLEQKNIPTRVGTDNDWQSVSCGGLFVLGLKYDKSLWQWGLFITNDSLDYIYDNITIPFCITTMVDCKMISAGFQAVFALNEDGTIWAYGDNTNYALGDSSIIFADEFIQITRDSNWNYIEAGSVYTFAINNTGELYAWGNNMYGQLGIDDGNDLVKTPTRVSNETEWKIVSAAKGIISGQYIYGMHSIAIKSDSSIICVTGANYVGQLGLGYINNGANAPFNCSKSDIEEKQLVTSDISLYPNPCSQTLYIDNTQTEIKDISIYDVMGREIRKHSINATKSTLDISNLHPGMYFLKIITEKGIITRKVQVIR